MGLANAIMAGAPVVANLVARFGFGEPPAPHIAPALAVSFAVGLLAMTEFSHGFRIGFIGGEPLLVAAAACWAWYSLAAQRWLEGLSQLHITALTVPAAGLWIFGAWLGLAAVGQMRIPLIPDLRESALIAWTALGGASVAANPGINAVSGRQIHQHRAL